MENTSKVTRDGKNDDITVKKVPINLYLLWCSKEKDNFTIQALFGSEEKFNFEIVERLFDGQNQNQNPCVYRLQLDMIRNTKNELMIKLKKGVWAAQKYQLRISEKGYIYNTHYTENTLRGLHNIDDSHHFLFDVSFGRLSPGMSLSS